jgi:hypothetical protein
MKYFAEMDGTLVVNTIVTDDDFSDPRYVEYTLENPACIGGHFFDGYFYPTQPFISWVKNKKGQWQPPIPKPEGDWVWNEVEGEWESVA